jgi:hypothetical protein
MPLMLMNRPSYTAVVFYSLFAVFLLQIFFMALSLTDSFSPDTESFYQFSEYRQPLYGMWMTFSFSILENWIAVKCMQLLMFCIASGILARELYLTGNVGRICAMAFVIFLLSLERYGALNYVAALISEGLFYSLLLVMASLSLRWFRTGNLVSLVVLIFLCVLTSQLKTTFLPVIGLMIVLILVLMVWALRIRRRLNRPRYLALTLVFLLSVILLPGILGKQYLQISTEKNRLGFVLIPRIASLSTPPHLRKELEQWSVMSESWHQASSNLGIFAFTQFDAQLQEEIRYYFYPSEIAPLLNKVAPELVMKQWQDGQGYDQASELAFQWIKNSPTKYLLDSGKHLLGLIFAAPLMTQSEREQVSIAFSKLSDATWQGEDFRNGYPVGDLSQPISATTNSFYIAIRITVFLFLVLTAFALGRILKAFWRREICTKSDLAISLSFLLLITISLAPALIVFPEIRFAAANLLIIFSGLLAHISLLSSPWQTSSGFFEHVKIVE